MNYQSIFMETKDHRKYVNNHHMTRDSVVPFYIDLIMRESDPSSPEVKRVNELILSKWSNSGLTYIKEKAWKAVNNLQPK